MEQPDAKLHFQVSLAKSALRIVAGLTLCGGAFVAAGVLLIIAELLGVAEEMV